METGRKIIFFTSSIGRKIIFLLVEVFSFFIYLLVEHTSEKWGKVVNKCDIDRTDYPVWFNVKEKINFQEKKVF